MNDSRAKNLIAEIRKKTGFERKEKKDGTEIISKAEEKFWIAFNNEIQMVYNMAFNNHIWNVNTEELKEAFKECKQWVFDGFFPVEIANNQDMFKEAVIHTATEILSGVEINHNDLIRRQNDLMFKVHKKGIEGNPAKAVKIKKDEIMLELWNKKRDVKVSFDKLQEVISTCEKSIFGDGTFFSLIELERGKEIIKEAKENSMNKQQVYDTSTQIIENLPDNLSSKNTIKLFLTAACSTKDGVDKNGNPIFWNPPNYISFDWIERNYKEFQTQKRIAETQEQTEKFKEKIKPFLYDENGTQFNRKYYRKFIKALFTIMRGTDTDYIESNVKKIIGHINYIKGRIQEESSLFCYSIGRGPGKSEIVYAYAKALERLGAGIKSSSLRDFCSKDGWTTEAPATYDLIYSLNELEDSEVDWNQEENYVKHGTYAIKQKFEKPIDTESKCHLAIATNSRSGQGNRWNTYIKFSDRFQWSKTNSKLDREKLINAWIDVITYCPRTICSLQELNEMPFQTTGPQSTILYRWLEKQAGCEVNYSSFLQKCRRDGKYTKNAEANWRKELELIENKGLIDIDWSSNSLEIIIRVNSDLDELYGGDRQPRGKQYLYNGISKALKFYIFTLLQNKLIDFSNDCDNNRIINQEKCKNVKDDKFSGTPVHGYQGGGKKVNNTPTKYTEYETINRLKTGSETASNDKVERMDSFLFEIDPPDNLTAEEKQADKELQKAHSKELFEQGIVNRVVDSGNKSIHNRVTISDPPDNVEQYKWIAHKLNDKFFNGKADKACFNPARLTRMPNAIRSDNGKVQELLYLSDSVLNFEWREDYNKDKMIEDYIAERQAEKYKSNFQGNNSAEELLKRNISPETRKLLTNSFCDGERHNEIPKAIGFLKVCGWSIPEIDVYVKATKINDSKDFTKNMYNYMKQTA